MIAVFKTNVRDKTWAEMLLGILYRHFPTCKINFDLDDCDKILRVEGDHLATESVKTIVNKNGFTCEILD